MPEMMLILLTLSLSGAVIAVLLVLLQAALAGRLSQKWRYYVWLVVVARLLIPVTIENSAATAFYNRADSLVAARSWEASGPQPSSPAVDYDWEQLPITGAVVQPKELLQTQSVPEAQDSGESPGSMTIWLAVYLLWAGVALALLARMAVGYRRSIRRIRSGNKAVTGGLLLEVYHEACGELGVRNAPGLYSNGAVSSPMLAGLFRPMIVLPPLEADREELRLILLHELIHHRRRDGWYKLLVHATACIHWFNPAVYLVRGRVDTACELSCDEAVIRRLDESSRLGYGDVLLSVVKTGRHSGPTAALMMGEDARTIKARLAAILRFRPGTRRMLAAAAAVTAAVLGGALLMGRYTTPHTRAYGDDAIVARSGNTYNAASLVQNVTSAGKDHFVVSKLNGVTDLMPEMFLSDRFDGYEFIYDVTVTRGKFKTVLVKDNETVEVLCEGSGSGSVTVPLSPGNYALKGVGKNAAVEMIHSSVLHIAQEAQGDSQAEAEGRNYNPAPPASNTNTAYTQRYAANYSAAIGARSLEGTWAAADTAQGTTVQEVRDGKLAFIEEIYRDRGEAFLIEEGISREEITDTEGIQYLYDNSEVYRSLVDVTGTVQIADSMRFSLLADDPSETLYERHVFSIGQPMDLELRASHALDEGKLGIIVVSPEGRIVHESQPEPAKTDRILLDLDRPGLWSVILVYEPEDHNVSGSKYVTGILSQPSGTASTDNPSREAVYAEYLEQGFDFRNWAYEDREVGAFTDRRTGGWMAVSNTAATQETAVYLDIVRDNSVPGTLGYGQILRIDSYSHDEWQARLQSE